MGDVPVDAAGSSGGDEACQVVGSVDEERMAPSNSISQPLELLPHVDDTTITVSLEPPDLSPGLAHKVITNIWSLAWKALVPDQKL